MTITITGGFWQWLVLATTAGFSSGLAGAISDDIITAMRLRQWKKQARNDKSRSR
jgi:hypothetical protein